MGIGPQWVPAKPRRVGLATQLRYAMAYLHRRYGGWSVAGGAGYASSSGATVPGMAHAVGSAVPVKILDNVESEDQARVKNDGPSSVVIAKDPLVAPTGADAFVVAANTEETVFLRPGEALYAICSSGQTASVEVI